MLVERSMDPGWLSNAYLVADEEGGTAVFVDSGAPIEPLLEAAERGRVQPEHVVRTHGDRDHPLARHGWAAHRGPAVARPLRGSPGVRRQRRAVLLWGHPLQGRGR